MRGVVMPTGMNVHRGLHTGVGFGEDSGCGYGYGMGGGGTLGESFGDEGLGSIFSFLGKLGKGIVNVASTAVGIGPIFPPGAPKAPVPPPIPTIPGSIAGSTATGSAPTGGPTIVIPGLSFLQPQPAAASSGISLSPTMLIAAAALAAVVLLSRRK
jgi:hypothetical protein